ncbi:hypothetical protein G6F47_000324 [Rhizopus delemar]|nr:hypothetical protein G6F54_008141 [Rhizopus delemar]KAG1516389.1 hypothetical protein G6F53_002193 [Rhizopus delemar]KAG1592093.1 hypothetical protein G6F48_002878 [Rhizopus delemar]KAG1605084.1 hypothetical protein G6F47_000324 [Rhizopus delemar]
MHIYYSSNAPPIPERPPRTDIEICNVKEGETVHQRFLLIHGRAGKRDDVFDLPIQVVCNDFGSTHWPCVNSYFKALVHLLPGPNTVTLLFANTTLHFHVHYLPLLQNPPLSLVILVGADSDASFDVPPEKRRQNKLEVAIEKFRMAGYLWQAFCAEQMDRNGMGRRTFRLEEAWLPDTVSAQDKGTMRTTAEVHVVRSAKTVRELRDRRRAQQGGEEDESVESLFGICLEDLKRHGRFRHPCHVACLILDSHWDPTEQVILGHAALGGGAGDLRLGIFGSHSLHAWPASIEDVVPCMMNDTLTDTRYVANDAGESGTWWMALNIGMGAMLHEVGHLYTLEHTPSGIMSRGFNNWNRTFMAKEPGYGPIPPEDEKGSHWHRSDIMRLRFHPAFRLPQDGPKGFISSEMPSFIPLESGQLEIKAPGGLSMIVMSVDGHYRTHVEFLKEQPKHLVLSTADVYQQCQCSPNESIKIDAVSVNQQEKSVDNLLSFLTQHKAQLPGIHGTVIKSDVYGNVEGESKYTVVFMNGTYRKELVHITIHHGAFLDGFVLHWSDGSKEVIGKLGGGRSGFAVLPGERIQGLVVRCGDWIDGLQFKMSSGRVSPWYGGHGGGPVSVEAPNGYELIGIHANANQWMNQIGIFYKKCT